jgi:hypothetical protein
MPDHHSQMINVIRELAGHFCSQKDAAKVGEDWSVLVV